MANEKNDPKKSENASASRPKRPTTIDLKATEIKPEPARKTETPPPSHDKSEAAAPPRPDGSESAAPRDPLRAAYGQIPKDWPWPLIGIAAAAAIVFFAIGLGAGQFFAARAPQPMAVAPEAQQIVAPTPELLARLAKLEAQLPAPRPDDVLVQTRLAKLETAVATPRVDDPQMLARIAAAEASVKALADLAATRERRSDEIAVMAREARERASSAAETAQAAQAAQKADAASPSSRADLDALANRIAALEQAARASQAELARRVTADDAKGRLAIAAIALRDAVESGMPFASELSAAKSLSADPAAIAALEPFAASGVPGAVALARELAALMPALWKAARKDEPQAGTFLERLQANAEKVVRIRPAGDVTGDDAASVKARIETRATSADIRGALAELAKLPPEARAPADAWIKKAQASNAAIAAARGLSQSALGALAKPAS